MTTATLRPAPTKAALKLTPKGACRLLAVNAGGEEILLRPEFIQGVYQIPVKSLSDDTKFVETPNGNIPAVSLSERLTSDLGFKPKQIEPERTAIIFRSEERSVALRVHSVSRPVEVFPKDIFQLPALAHPVVGPSFLDSLALVHDEDTNKIDRVALLINPMVALDFTNHVVPFHESIKKQDRVQVPRKSLNGDSVDRGHSTRKLQFERGNAQLLAFSARTPISADVDFRFCLPMSVIAEVLLDQPVFQLPSASSILSGYLIWRSKPVPVIDLSKAFGGVDSDVPIAAGRILISRTPGGQFVAIPTEMEIRILKTPKVASIPFPPIDSYPHLGAFRDPSGLLVLPDLAAILAPKIDGQLVVADR